MIISATRRTDIPSYYGEWFVNRLKAGYVLIQNPYNNDRYSKAVLTREAVDIIVFWTKNPKPFLKYLPIIEKMGYLYYFQFTLTPYGKQTEKGLPSKEDLINTFIELSERIGKKRLVWRYDPIIISDIYTLDYHTERFSYMAKKLSSYTERCVISFVDSYKNVTTRMGQDPAYKMTKANIYALAEAFSKIAKEQSIELFTCAEQIDLVNFGIKHGACIDKDLIEDILGQKINVKKDKNQRKECLCADSIDIGTYNCCANGCSYCYALTSEKAALSNMAKHNPKLPVLIGEVNNKAIITDRDSFSIVESQLSFF